MKKYWAIRKDAEAVSPVIATILMVAITVVLAAVLYVMVLGFGGTSVTTPTATYSKSPISLGEQVNIVSITRADVAWDQIKVQFSDGDLFWEWSTATDDLNGGIAITMNYGAYAPTGGVNAYLNVTDVGGNGYVSGSDYFRVTVSGGLVSGTAYTAVLIYTETGEKIGTGVSFNG